MKYTQVKNKIDQHEFLENETAHKQPTKIEETIRHTQQILADESEARKQTVLYHQIRQQREQLRSQALQLRRLSRRVIRAQEEERKRVSRELHDDAGQSLTLLKVSLELILVSLLENHVSPQLCKRVSEAIDTCEATMAHIRMLAHNLRPSALDDLGLNLTLEGLCQDFSEHTRLPIHYTGEDTPVLVDSAEICLYRCLQEGLTNIARHANAAQVRVCLSCDQDAVRLIIEDDGMGFDPASDVKNSSHGMGLIGLRERLAAVGGELTIQSQPGSGSRLAIIVSRKEAGASGDHSQE
jgi:signal transduction histidine kinase